MKNIIKHHFNINYTNLMLIRTQRKALKRTKKNYSLESFSIINDFYRLQSKNLISDFCKVVSAMNLLGYSAHNISDRLAVPEPFVQNILQIIYQRSNSIFNLKS